LAVLFLIPTDYRYYLELKRQLDHAWSQTGEIAQDPPVVPKKERNSFACRLAERAISRVGLLTNTKANALVYQKVILDEMKAINVRFSDRVRILPLAVAACLYRPSEVRDVERWIQRFVSPTNVL